MDVQCEKQISTPVSNSTLFNLLLLSLATQKHSPKTTIPRRDEYDYIIVGGGAAGSVVASRLSEKSCVSVLLLEAGPEPPLLTEVPALLRYFWGTNVDWNYKTVPQKHSASALVNRQMFWTAGKMLGGSGSLNGMIYVRGNKKDYDHWAKLGAKGWSYNEIFHYFLKLEDNRTPAFLANGYHAVGGPITVEQPHYQPALKKAAMEAALRMGYKFVDPNGKHQTGFYDLQGNLRNNQRCSAVKGYLVPADKRKNLDISVNSFVTRIIFKDVQASAVEYFDGVHYHQVKVKKEVIVTAGAVNTPKILMLSGVGPKKELNKFNIPVVSNLPVGRNFQDHCGAGIYFTMDSRFRAINEKLSDPLSISQYITSRSGPLSSIQALLTAFLYRLNTTTPFDFPNYQFYFGELDSSFTKKLGLKPEVYEKIFGPYENRPIFLCVGQILRPRSRGTITLNSSNPFDGPMIDPNYLEDPRDLDDVVDGLKLCKKMLATEPLLRLGAKPFQSLMPGCEIYVDDEDEYLRCYTKASLYTYNHVAGSAKMGNPLDPATVVDPELRVKGVKGLRVADASVMPQVTSGNTHTPVLMIAEKASDMIKRSISCSIINKM